MSHHRKFYDRHHRKPRSIGGDSGPENLSLVPRHKHMAWHLLFSNMTADVIAEIINAHWLDPAYEMRAVPRHPVRRKSRR